MLVLSRKPGEQIRIGNDIVLTVQRLSGNRVSIGIDAPRDYRIVRGELNVVVESAASTNATANDGSSTALGENRIAEHLAKAFRRAK